MTHPLAVATVGEVASVLALFPSLGCTPYVEVERGKLTVTIVLSLATTDHDPEAVAELRTIELHNQLQRLLDVANLRAIAARWDIPPDRLEKLLPPDVSP